MKNIVSQVRLEEEKDLLYYLESVINAPVIHNLLTIKDENMGDDLISSYMKQNNLPLSEQLGGRFYKICRNVQNKLGMGDIKIEFLISSNRDVNASSIFNVNHSGNNPHFIILNSGLIELLNEDELSFVVGHEIGHLIYEHTHFKRILKFVYPEYTKLPYHLKNCYDFWCKICEISADRVGLMAVHSVEKSVLAIFKLYSGLSDKLIDFKYNEFLSTIDQLLSEMSDTPFHTFSTHPANPIRVKALEIFYASDTWQAILKKQLLSEDSHLQDQTDQLVSILKKLPGHSIEKAELDFLASAGFMLISCDKEIHPEEMNDLINLLSQYLYMPQALINAIDSGDKAIERLKESSSYIVEHYPERTRQLFMALLPLLMRDGKLHENEVEAAIKVATEELKIPFQETIDLILDCVRAIYAPFS